MRSALLTALLPLAGLAAQDRAALVLLLRDPSGQPVASAEGLLLPNRGLELPALAGLEHRPLERDVDAPVEPLIARSDARGVLRFSGPTTSRAGAVLVTTAAGLGALIPRVLPGEAVRVTLEPLGEVGTSTGSETFTLHAAHAAIDGTRSLLPPKSGTAVRLPAGSYEAWARSEDGWIWQRLDVLPGRRSTLLFTGAAQPLRRASGHRVHPQGWPQVELLGPGAEHCVLLGAALAAPLLASDPGTGRVSLAQIPVPPRQKTIEWPPAELATPAATTLTLAPDPSLAGALVQLFVLRRSDAGSWRLLGAAAASPGGQASLPDGGDGDDWLLALTPGRPPFAMPWSRNPVAAPLAMPTGLPLVVRCRDELGDPAVDVALEFVPAAGDVAALMARSDGRGRAAFGPLGAPGLLRASDPRFANVEVPLQLVPEAGLDLTLPAGASVTGKITLPDGSPPGPTVVTLRDPSGRLRPAQRAAMTAADGTFRFPGLDEVRDYVLFATATRGGHTWSAKATRVAPRSAPVLLVLHDEDPVFHAPDKDR